LEDLVLLKLLWSRAKDVADIHALLALSGQSFDTDYATSTLEEILPPQDPRHQELRSLIVRFTTSVATDTDDKGPQPQP
jgi:hypothetical protein